MFKRYASATILEKISLAQSKKLVFAEDDKPVSFEYDPENFTYFRCRAITADDPNGNGDLFPNQHVRDSFKTFIGIGLYKDHDSDSIDKAIGKVLHAEYIEPAEGHPYVETICAVDKQLAPDLARRVESGIATSVSMGCAVREAECSICHNIASNPQELCQHMMPGFGVKGRKNPDGSIIYEINRGIQFTELSLVTVPADPTARIFEVYADLHGKKMTMSRADFIQGLVKIAESATPEQMCQLHDWLISKGCTFNNSIGAEAIFADKEAKAVEKKDELVEKEMGLAIIYTKGSSLGSSFFVASDGKSTYRCAASDVLPVVVQKSIEHGDPGVVTPERLIQDLTQKYASVGDFKAWAKRRRKKNRQATERKDGCKEAEAPKADSVETAMPAKTEEAAKPRIDEIKAAASDNGRSTMDKKVEAELEKKADAPAAPAAAAPAAAEVAAVVEAPKVETPAPAEAAKPEDKTGEIFAAFEALRKYVESKLTDLQKREAVKTESNAGKAIADGEHGDKSVSVSAKGVEDPKTESPKGHMDKGAALKVEAMDKDWSVNPKELEKAAKPAKADGLNLPPVMSVERKEASSESVDTAAGGKAGATVKKFYNRLPAGGPGVAPQALDAKSAQDPEKEMLRKALQEEKAEKERLLEKERLQSIADKVFEIVTAMKSGNLLADGKEDAVIDTLTARFADLNQLENVKTLVAHLSVKKAAAAEGDAKSEPELPVGQVVPQVFETVETSEDAVQKMASIWNR
jgi:hypothetical protein